MNSELSNTENTAAQAAEDFAAGFQEEGAAAGAQMTDPVSVSTPDSTPAVSAAPGSGGAEMLRQQGAELARPWQEFVKAHPECTAKSMGRDFYALVHSGLSPLAAYERLEGDKVRQEAASLRAQLIALQKNSDNRQRSVGRLSGDGAAADPFLVAFADIT